MSDVRTLMEAVKCHESPAYFLHHYCQVYDATSCRWLPFRLWPAQREAARAFHAGRLVCALKARQLGWTWLAVGYALWTLLFRPGSTVMLFSRRDDEAVDLLGFRLKGMAKRLPAWLALGRPAKDDAHLWHLAEGSRAMAFPTTGGRSHTASLVVVDEADWVPDLDALLSAVKPATDAGGKLILLSTAGPDPESPFKRTYRAARAGANGFAALFSPWQARPGRDGGWYEGVRSEIWERTGSLEELHREYPAADEEALAAGTGSREFPPEWFTDAIWFDDWPAGIIHRAVGWDPSKSRTSREGDYSAFVSAGLDGAGRLWVDADLGVRNPAANVEAAYGVCEAFSPGGVLVEANQFLDLFADMLRQRAERDGHWLPLYLAQNRAAKEVRIRRLAPWLAQGRIRFRRGSPGARLLVGQLRGFPDKRYKDDGPDALEMAVRMLDHLLGARRGDDGIEVMST